MYNGPDVFRSLVSLVSVIPLALTFVQIPLHQGSLSPEEKDLMKICHVGLSIPGSLTHFTFSGCGSLYLF